MSRFFDFNNEPVKTNDSVSLPVGADSEEPETSLQLRQIPTQEVYVHPASRIIMHTNPLSPGADRFRLLRMCLRELWNAGKLKSLLITSPLPGDGKSTIAMNLATALAEGGKLRVLLIEADLYRPGIVEELSIEARPGLAECLERGLNPESLLQRLKPLNWYLLPAGEVRGSPTDLLHTEALALIIQQLSSHFDWILIDSPPISPFSDALILARQANATLLVAREGSTPDEAIEKAIALLGRQRVLGIVLNGVKGLERLYSGYYGYSEDSKLRSVGSAKENIPSRHQAIPTRNSGVDSLE